MGVGCCAMARAPRAGLAFQPAEFQSGAGLTCFPFHIHGVEATHLQVLQKAPETREF